MARLTTFQLVVFGFYVISAVIAVRVWRSHEHLWSKILFTALLLFPILGPLAFLWVRNWPSRLPAELDGQEAGFIGRRYLVRQLSGKSTTVKEELQHNLDERERRQLAKKRSVARKRRYMKIGKKDSDE